MAGFAFPFVAGIIPGARPYQVLQRHLSTDYSDWKLRKQTRLTRYQFNYLLERIHPLIESDSESPLTIEADTKLLAVLEFLATGEFQYTVSRSYGFSQDSMSEFITQVVGAINTLAPQFIRAPSTVEEMENIADAFEEDTNFPEIIGCIDGTLINIQAPSVDEPAFVDRKGNHSIVCQLVCDSKMRIWDVNVMWPGSTNDAAVFQVCGLRRRFEDGDFGNFKLLGDRGYRIEKYLLTIYRDARTRQQIAFNELHKSTRSIVERCIGLLKGRWRCLHGTGGNLVYTPGKICHIINACCVLHNMCFLTENGFVPDIDPVDENLMRRDAAENQQAGDNRGAQFRAALTSRDQFVARHPNVFR